VSLNGGDDNFWFYNGVTPGRVDGGTGTDTFAPENGDGCLDVTATLNASYTCTVNLPGEPLDYRVALAGFETYNSFDAIRSATIIGTSGPDTIRVYAPTTIVRGLQGNDSIYADAEYPVRAYLRGDQGADTLVGGGGRDRLLGGRGNDKMRGRSGRDQLHGGMGTDSAKGSTGRDTCRAETRRSCER
jgi:Ca2+-binding RTX toxin-like protein